MLQATQHSFHRDSAYRFQKPVVYQVKRTKRVPCRSWSREWRWEATGELQQNRHGGQGVRTFPIEPTSTFSTRTTCASDGSIHPPRGFTIINFINNISLKSASTNPRTHDNTTGQFHQRTPIGNEHLPPSIPVNDEALQVWVFVCLCFLCVSTVSFLSGFYCFVPYNAHDSDLSSLVVVRVLWFYSLIHFRSSLPSADWYSFAMLLPAVSIRSVLFSALRCISQQFFQFFQLFIQYKWNFLPHRAATSGS